PRAQVWPLMPKGFSPCCRASPSSAPGHPPQRRDPPISILVVVDLLRRLDAGGGLPMNVSRVQSLLSWVSFVGCASLRVERAAAWGVNPCCRGSPSSAVGLTLPEAVLELFQSLLSWISFVGQAFAAAQARGRKNGFQSLLSWISFVGYHLAGGGHRTARGFQ